MLNGTGGLDLIATLKPGRQRPTAYRPSRADAPTSENIRWIVNAEINAAHAYKYRQKRRHRDEVETDLEGGLASRQKRRYRQIGNADSDAWPLGKLEVKTRVAGATKSGRGRTNANLSNSLSAMPPVTATSIDQAAACARAKNK